MSQGNVELVRNLYAEWDFQVVGKSLRGRLDRLFREYLDEHFEFRLPPDYPEGELVFRGRNGMEQSIALLHDTWAEWRFEPERFLDAGDRVVVFIRIVGRGGASGVPIELETTHVLTIHAGRIASMQVYRNRSEALEAAGLRE